jgi:hypothetical protein
MTDHRVGNACRGHASSKHGGEGDRVRESRGVFVRPRMRRAGALRLIPHTSRMPQRGGKSEIRRRSLVSVTWRRWNSD